MKTILALLISSSSLLANSIYGSDDRLDYYELRSDDLKSLTSSVAARISANDVIIKNNSYKLKSHQYGQRHMLCEDEKFYNQITIGDCTGFLIDKDIIVTAGHCIQSKQDCKNSYWLFDHKMKNKDSNLTTGPTDNLFRCKKIKYKQMTYNSSSSKGADIDFAIIQLDRITKREPLKLALDKAMESDEIFVMGHPKGLPLKIAANSKVQSLSHNTFYANLDTYSGNSGSPVFNQKTLEVVGILSAGKMDFSAKREYGQEQCQFSTIYRDDPSTGETVNYIQNIFNYLK